MKTYRTAGITIYWFDDIHAAKAFADRTPGSQRFGTQVVV